MGNFNDYINTQKIYIANISQTIYAGNIGYNSVIYSCNTQKPTSSVCFASLYSTMVTYNSEEKKYSSNYFLRLPYSLQDKDENLHKTNLDFPSILDEINSLICDVYTMEIHNTQCKNVKLITFSNKIDLSLQLDYTITLIIFCILRGLGDEYIPTWVTYNNPFPNNLKDYIYTLAKISRGSHHDINDSIDRIVRLKDPQENLSFIMINNFINTMKTSFGKNGLINDSRFKKYFTEIFKLKPDGYGNVMQTECFNIISKITNKILFENEQ